MSPAKRLVETDDRHQAVSVNHKEYLMATDDRYPSSAKTVVRLDGDEGAVHYLSLIHIYRLFRRNRRGECHIPEGLSVGCVGLDGR